MGTTSELAERCEVCRAMLDEEDLFCANCGREASRPEAPAANGGEAGSAKDAVSTHTFQCQGCGASMSYDASVQTLHCPFCGSTQFDETKDAKVLKPRRMVPFAVDRGKAEQTLRSWLGKGFWRPGDLASSAVVTKLSAVMAPYWVFQANTFTYWTADTSQTPSGARGDWYPLTGEHRSSYTGLLIGASSVLTPQETNALLPFDIEQARDGDYQPSREVIVEQFRVQRKYARPLARGLVESLERTACAKYVPGRSRNVKVNVKLEGLTSEPVLLPIWVMAYRYQDKLYRFLINGQTGRASGKAPFSWRKLLMVVGIVLAVVFGGLLLFGLIGAVAGGM